MAKLRFIDISQSDEELDSNLIQANQTASTEPDNTDAGNATVQDVEQVENAQAAQVGDRLKGPQLNAKSTDEAGASAGNVELAVADQEVADLANGSKDDAEVTASIAGIASGASKVTKTGGSKSESTGEAEAEPASETSNLKLPADLATPAKPWESNQANLETQLVEATTLATSHYRQADEGQDSTNPAELQTEASEESLKTVGAGTTEERRADAPTTRPVEDRHMVRLNASQQRRFVQRVSRAFDLAPQRGGEIRLRLSPPALGSLKVELKIEGKQMAARLEAENQAAKNLLLEHLPQLRDRLAEQGFSIETFEVDLHHDETGDAQRESDAQDAADRERSRGDRNRVEQLEHDDSPGTETNHLESNSLIEGQINVIV